MVQTKKLVVMLLIKVPSKTPIIPILNTKINNKDATILIIGSIIFFFF